MTTHTFIVESSLTVDDAFARLIDLTRVSEWDSGVSSSTQVHGDAHIVGSRYDVTVTGFDGKPTSVVYEILNADPPSCFVMEGANDVFRANDTLSLESSDTGCTLTYVGVLELLGTNPPLTNSQLDSVFPKIAAVAQAGLQSFLNP